MQKVSLSFRRTSFLSRFYQTQSILLVNSAKFASGDTRRDVFNSDERAECPKTSHEKMKVLNSIHFVCASCVNTNLWKVNEFAGDEASVNISRRRRATRNPDKFKSEREKSSATWRTVESKCAFDVVTSCVRIDVARYSTKQIHLLMRGWVNRRSGIETFKTNRFPETLRRTWLVGAQRLRSFHPESGCLFVSRIYVMMKFISFSRVS